MYDSTYELLQSLLANIDRTCSQFALALHNSEPFVYAASQLLFSSGFCCSHRETIPIKSEILELRGSWRVYRSATDMRSAEMLSLVITLLIIALIAGILGFGGIAGAAVGIAKIVFFVALVLFVISLLSTGFRGGFGRGL